MSDESLADTAEFPVADCQKALKEPREHSSLVKVDFAAKSDIGKVRHNNEDSYLIFRTARFWEKIATSLPEDALPNRFEETAYVLAVADGMGGMAAGEVASAMALRTGVHLILQSVKWAHKLDHPNERDRELHEGMERARKYFNDINLKVNREATNNPKLSGMGTTLTAAFTFGTDLLVTHIGDSRAYLLHNGSLEQLTTDHTVAQTLVDQGQISKKEAAQHHSRHVLTKSIGGEPDELEPHFAQRKLSNGDWLLLCSDGLTDHVEDDLITRILLENSTAKGAVNKLVDRALKNGGRDNVTVVLGKYTIPES